MDSGIPAAGWYADVEDPALLRYWDGQAWTVHTQPRVAPPRPPAPASAGWAQPAPTRPSRGPAAYPAWAYDTPSPARRVRSLWIALALVLLAGGFAVVASHLSHAPDRPLARTPVQPEARPWAAASGPGQSPASRTSSAPPASS